jgi:hypothetical protein
VSTAEPYVDLVLERIGRDLLRAEKQIARRRARRRVTSTAVVILAATVVAGAIAGGAPWTMLTRVTTPSELAATAADAQAANLCLIQHGAVLSDSGDSVTRDAQAACAYLSMASLASLHRETEGMAPWFRNLGSQPVAFWDCLARANFSVPLDGAPYPPAPGYPQGAPRDDFQSPGFAQTAATCATQVGVRIPDLQP